MFECCDVNRTAGSNSGREVARPQPKILMLCLVHLHAHQWQVLKPAKMRSRRAGTPVSACPALLTRC